MASIETNSSHDLGAEDWSSLSTLARRKTGGSNLNVRNAPTELPDAGVNGVNGVVADESLSLHGDKHELTERLV